VSSLLDIASNALLQDYDALIHFAYYTWGNPDLIASFGPQSDPPRWGLFGYAAQMFIRGELPSAPERIALAFNDDDLFTWASFYRPFHRLAWTHRIENWYTGWDRAAGVKPPLLTVGSGRSGLGNYQGNNLLLFDAHYGARSQLPEAQRAQGVLARSGYDFPWTYTEGGFPLDAVQQAGHEPVFPDEEQSRCQGMFDEQRNTLVLSRVSEGRAASVAGNFARWLSQGKQEALEESLEQDSDTCTALDGRLVRDTQAGVLTIAGDRLCAVAGQLEPGKEYRAGALVVNPVSPIGAVVTASLDDRPLSRSRRFSVKMVTVAQNRGQMLTKVEDPGAPKPFVLEQGGAPPVQTLGKGSDTPTRVFLDGRTIVEAYLVNGTWEAVVDLDKHECLLFCDTPNVRFAVDREVFGEVEPDEVTITKYFYEYPPVDAGQSGWDFIYPGFAKYVRLNVK